MNDPYKTKKFVDSQCELAQQNLEQVLSNANTQIGFARGVLHALLQIQAKQPVIVRPPLELPRLK